MLEVKWRVEPLNYLPLEVSQRVCVFDEEGYDA
jgi:hypothetical protein